MNRSAAPGEQPSAVSRQPHATRDRQSVFTCRRVVIGLLMVMVVTGTAAAQVFPPRPSGSPPQGPPSAMPQAPPQMTLPAPQQMPPARPAQPQPLSKVMPFAMILGGDFTKSFVQLGNLRGPLDSQFVVGRSLAGYLNVERYLSDVGNGNKSLMHVTGLSNPPLVTSEGGEVRLQYVFPAIQFKAFYKDYSGEGDSAIPDVVTERAVLDLYVRPVIDPRGLPTYQSVRIVFNAEIKEPEKCRVWFDVIFPVNVCDIAKDYIKQMKPAIENGMRDGLQHPQARTQFEQALWPYLRAELLVAAGINPAGPTQLQIMHAELRGTDYAVSYLPRP